MRRIFVNNGIFSYPYFFTFTVQSAQRRSPVTPQKREAGLILDGVLPYKSCDRRHEERTMGPKNGPTRLESFIVLKPQPTIIGIYPLSLSVSTYLFYYLQFYYLSLHNCPTFYQSLSVSSFMSLCLFFCPSVCQ